MKYIELLLVALQSMIVNKTRAMLTMLGIIIGVGSVIAVVAIGQGAQYNVQQQIANLGSNVIMIMPGAAMRGGASSGAGSFNRLQEEHATIIRDRATAVSAVTPLVFSGAQVIFGNNNWSTRIQGVYPDYLQIREWSIDDGTFFTDQQNRSGAKVCVIGRTVADALFPGQSPVGQVIRIRNLPFQVIGVLTAKGQSFSGNDQDDVILAPFRTVQNKVRGRDYIHMILASAKSEKEIPLAVNEVNEILSAAMRIPRGQDAPFVVSTQTEIAQTARETSDVFTSLLYSVAAVSLLVGGIGIMNIMLVSVSERTREIGIRRAIGARRIDILLQFLVEAILLSLAGGVLGIAAGIAGSNVISSLQEWPTLISPQAIALAVVVAVAVGVFFGWYPARKASMLDPIEALRYE